jgi:dTDP-4-amino-4,6-dideoxygalactose transaminase
LKNSYIPFNKPFLVGREIEYITKAHNLNQLAGDGIFTEKCHQWFEKEIGCGKALITHSCTAALEMCAILADIEPGDEIIMPSFTFVSTANAFVMRGAVPVFVDINPWSLNINESLIEEAITPRTKAIVPVHYAGVACEMDKICQIAKTHNLLVIEDAAQGICARYNKQALGGIGNLGCISFHETKNIQCGEGGVILINDERFSERAEIIREKGTNRSKFMRGDIDKYRWVDIGSSYLPGEVITAFLYAQLEHASEITKRRLDIWMKYHQLFEGLEKDGKVTRPKVPKCATPNAHIYYLLLNSAYDRKVVLSKLEEKGINAVFHYQPLHSSPAGKKWGRKGSELNVTDDVSKRLIRLPMWLGFEEHERVVSELIKILK